MTDRTFLARNWREIVTFLGVVISIFALLALVLWTTLPFGCSPEECLVSRDYLRQERLHLLLLFGPTTSVILAPAAVFLLREIRGRSNLFSALARAALSWPILSCVLLFPLFLYGAILAPVGVAISVVALITTVVKGIRSHRSPIHWTDLLPLASNTAWSFLAYAYVVRSWQVFGD
jgi:hypothetical protein